MTQQFNRKVRLFTSKEHEEYCIILNTHKVKNPNNVNVTNSSISKEIVGYFLKWNNYIAIKKNDQRTSLVT